MLNMHIVVPTTVEYITPGKAMVIAQFSTSDALNSMRQILFVVYISVFAYWKQ